MNRSTKLSLTKLTNFRNESIKSQKDHDLDNGSSDNGPVGFTANEKESLPSRRLGLTTDSPDHCY